MKNKLKELFLSKITENKKTPADISSYTLIRTGTGLWNNKIYWKVKGEKNVKVYLTIKLNNDINAVKSTIDAMEEIIHDGTKAEIDFGQNVRTEKGSTGW